MTQNLFDIQKEQILKNSAPLAARMRPKTLDDFLGQEEIIGEGTLLCRAIKADRLPCMIFYGPPGTGKTTLAAVIANTTKSVFTRLNATTSGVKDIKAVIDEANAALGTSGKRTILFIDEIHRFNKSQQDALLPHVEDGTVILIGATTENPYFEVNKALISRCAIFRLNYLSTDNIKRLITKTLSDNINGLGMYDVLIDTDAADFIADMAGGDARRALNALELAVLTTIPGENGVIHIDINTASACTQKRVLSYDKNGDSHYDVISAFIKSMRGSDPDAAVHYLARMIAAGEDPKFIARRIVICASEDVGNADPHALMLATAAARAVEYIGLPECSLNLAQAVTYIACAPKSNASTVAISKAMDDINKITTSVPAHLRDSHYPGASELNHGTDYKYAHDYPGHYVLQQYMPDELTGVRYYEPSDNGVEKKIKESLKRLRG